MQSLARELEEFSVGHIGTVLCCDANVHHSRWLKFSDGNTALGQDLKDICDNAGLSQIVREPTRKNNLLDLVLTSMPDISKASVLSSISDHRAVLVEVSLEVPKSIEIEREVWIYQKADWQGLKDALSQQTWNFLKTASVDEGAQELTDIILDTAKKFIPKRKIKQKKSSHPWLTEACREAVSRKNDLEAELLQKIQSPESEEEAHDLEARLQDAIQVSNKTMSEAFELHVEKTREKINSLPRGSKEWWRLNRSLLGRSQKQNVSIPPLRDKDKNWILENDKKAELFAETFAAKAKLPAVQGEWIPKQLGTKQSDLLLLRTKASENILKNLDADKATGPDALPAKILKICSAQLAVPVTLLARRMLSCEVWPGCWKSH